mgnify:CR=1 FL=1
MDLTEKQITYFWERVDMSGGPDACWDWTFGYCGGYGRVKYNYKNWGTHNLALRLTEGPPPPDKTLALHSCKQNRKCCNPAHLRWGDDADNVNDRDKDGTTAKQKGELHGRAKLTDAQVLDIRQKYKPRTLAKLGREYGVNASTISDIINRESWKHI